MEEKPTLTSLKYKLNLLQAEIAHHIEHQIKYDAALHEKLDLILEQTKKTNGSVAEMKRQLAAAEHEIHLLQIADVAHSTNCPNSKKIEEINTSLLEYKFFVKYPKALYAAIFIMVVTAILAAFSSYQTLKESMNKNNPVKQTSKIENHGTQIAYSRIKELF